MDSSEQDTNDRRPEFSLTLRFAPDMEVALKERFDFDVSELTTGYGGQTRDILDVYAAAACFAREHNLQPVNVGWGRRRSAESLILRAMVHEDEHKRFEELTLMLARQLVWG